MAVLFSANLVSLESSVKDVSLEPGGRGGSDVSAVESCSQGKPSCSLPMLDRTSSQSVNVVASKAEVIPYSTGRMPRTVF